MKFFLKKLLPLIDAILILPTIFCALGLKLVRRLGVQRLPFTKRVLRNIGIFPLTKHYYEPQFDNASPRIPYSRDRELSGINWNVAGQLAQIEKLKFHEELKSLNTEKPDDYGFYVDNDAFKSGDAEYWYQIIRALKPKKIIEIGSGYSTLLAIKAIEKNRSEDHKHQCKLTCIEPYEMPWLEKEAVEVIRQPVEHLETSFFSSLGANDILFIDSSHIIRPQGDVLYEYLELLPTLSPGVVVHIHDIFSPRNYLESWLVDDIKFWNEQYLLEAFLTNNDSWEIIGSLNFLHHHHYDSLKSIAPFLKPSHEPGSFYIRKIK